MSIKYVLITDGSSDQTLKYFIDYTLTKFFPSATIEGQWADFRNLTRPPKTLKDKIVKAIDFYEPQWIFIHRDAENVALQDRAKEIATVVGNLPAAIANNIYISIIPVRMTEAWLLIDEMAIRQAAGNPEGKTRIALPKLKELEKINDTKQLLFEALKTASQLSGRRLKNLDLNRSRRLIAQYIDDFSPLHDLSSYQHFNEQVKHVAKQLDP